MAAAVTVAQVTFSIIIQSLVLSNTCWRNLHSLYHQCCYYFKQNFPASLEAWDNKYLATAEFPDDHQENYLPGRVHWYHSSKPIENHQYRATYKFLFWGTKYFCNQSWRQHNVPSQFSRNYNEMFSRSHKNSLYPIHSTWSFGRNDGTSFPQSQIHPGLFCCVCYFKITLKRQSRSGF